LNVIIQLIIKYVIGFKIFIFLENKFDFNNCNYIIKLIFLLLRTNIKIFYIQLIWENNNICLKNIINIIYKIIKYWNEKLFKVEETNFSIFCLKLIIY
jgi:hypothetical protein